MATGAETGGLADKARQLGDKYEREMRGCAQCLLAALNETLDLDLAAMFPAATALAGGVGLQGDGCCGAYLGGAMLLGHLTGRTLSDLADKNGRRFTTYKLAARLHDMFIAEYGSVICRDLMTKTMGRPFFLADPEEMKKFDLAGGHLDKCPAVVGRAAGWVVELLAAEGLLPGRKGA